MNSGMQEKRKCERMGSTEQERKDRERKDMGMVVVVPLTVYSRSKLYTNKNIWIDEAIISQLQWLHKEREHTVGNEDKN